MSDYIDLKSGKESPVVTFNKKLADVRQKYAKLHKPFDSTCCRLDFKDKLDYAEKESERRHGFIDLAELKIDFGEFDKYADEDRFVLLEDQEDVQDKVIEGSRTQVLIGHTLSYKCKARGHGISVFIPIKEYNEMQKKPVIKDTKEIKEKK